MPVCTTYPRAYTSTETCISPTNSFSKCRIASRTHYWHIAQRCKLLQTLALCSYMHLTCTLPARRQMEVKPDAVMFKLAQFLCRNGVREPCKFHVVNHLHGNVYIQILQGILQTFLLAMCLYLFVHKKL